MPHRPFTPRQLRQNAAFLEALRRSGNVRLTCRELGVHRSTWTKRRAKCAAFATVWDMTLAAAHAAFQRAGGERMPEAGKGGPGDDGLRTKGGEPMIVRLANGRLQRRLAPPGRMTRAAEGLFFTTLSETANLRMAAAAAGFAHSSVLARRARPAFAQALEMSREAGRDRVSWLWREARRSDLAEWTFDASLPMPKMTAEQAILQLVYHCPDGPFQRSLWHRRPPPIPFAKVAPRIRVRFEAMRRAGQYERRRT